LLAKKNKQQQQSKQASKQAKNNGYRSVPDTLTGFVDLVIAIPNAAASSLTLSVSRFPRTLVRCFRRSSSSLAAFSLAIL